MRQKDGFTQGNKLECLKYRGTNETFPFIYFSPIQLDLTFMLKVQRETIIILTVNYAFLSKVYNQEKKTSEGSNLDSNFTVWCQAKKWLVDDILSMFNTGAKATLIQAQPNLRTNSINQEF